MNVFKKKNVLLLIIYQDISASFQIIAKNHIKNVIKS